MRIWELQVRQCLSQDRTSKGDRGWGCPRVELQVHDEVPALIWICTVIQSTHCQQCVLPRPHHQPVPHTNNVIS